MCVTPAKNEEKIAGKQETLFLQLRMLIMIKTLMLYSKKQMKYFQNNKSE